MTKILAFSDIHCDLKVCRALVEPSNKVDLVIGAGDFATARRGLRETIQSLSEIRKPFVLVPGNSESFEELKDECANFPNMHPLHGSSISIDRISIFGIGGGIPVTPFGSWSFDFSEEEAEGLLSACQKGGILVSHSPPRGAVDVTSSGKSIGSTAILRAITEKRPRLCICGHVHSSAGLKAFVGETLVVNVGPTGIILDYPYI
ncbi:MAG: metallophosphoesterase family protein [Hyphomicrobiales bacterium]|nr:metallophosphoesterase family protein [Hyphomicrobiales bacterium]